MHETTAYRILEALSSRNLLSVDHTGDTVNGEVSKRRRLRIDACTTS